MSTKFNFGPGAGPIAGSPTGWGAATGAFRARQTGRTARKNARQRGKTTRNERRQYSIDHAQDEETRRHGRSQDSADFREFSESLRHERSQQSADYVAYLGNDAERATARHRTWRTIAIAGAAAIAAVVGFLSVDNWSDDRRQAELQQQQMQHELNMGGLGLGDEILDGDGGASLRITTGEGGDTTLEIADDSTKK